MAKISLAQGLLAITFWGISTSFGAKAKKVSAALEVQLVTGVGFSSRTLIIDSTVAKSLIYLACGLVSRLTNQAICPPVACYILRADLSRALAIGGQNKA